MKRILTLFIVLYFSYSLQADELKLHRNIKWQVTEIFDTIQQKKLKNFRLENSTQLKEYGFAPVYVETLPFNQGEVTSIELVNPILSTIDGQAADNIELLARSVEMPSTQFFIGYERGKPLLTVLVRPYYYSVITGKTERLESFSLIIKYKKQEQRVISNTIRLNKTGFTPSPLSSGEWFKIGFQQDGVYKISFQDLQNLGINPSNIKKNQIRLFGKIGGALPQSVSAPKDSDLIENAIFVSGNGNDNFSTSDYILFYGKSPIKWNHNASRNRYNHLIHHYCDTSYLFINIASNGAEGKRITTLSSTIGTPTHTVKFYDEYTQHHIDRMTELSRYVRSGREFFGEEFDKVVSYDFNYSFPNYVQGSPIYFRSQVFARSQAFSNFEITFNGSKATQTVSRTYFEYLSPYALGKTDTFNFTSNTGNFNINYKYVKPDNTSYGWLNFFEIQTRNHLKYNGGQIFISDGYSVGTSRVNQYEIENPSNKTPIIWNVTDFHSIQEQAFTSNAGVLSFQSTGESIKYYQIFEPGSEKGIIPFGKIHNQDLHGMEQPEMVIISHPNFYEAAKRVKDFHEKKDNFKVAILTPQAIYNEFSTGSQDITAIRDFVKHLYKRNLQDSSLPVFKYLLLFGDASFDYKDRFTNNTNFVPTYESPNSSEVLETYASDDYFGYLDDSEGDMTSSFDKLDINIGRIPVKNLTEANQFVDKMYRYVSPDAMGDWRNTLTFVGDDEDWNTYIDDSERLIETILKPSYKSFNFNKIYLDAYKQVSGASGQKYPEVTKEINAKMAKGSLTWSYMGHGGEEGLAHERVVEVEQIKSWKNKNALPIFVTATCELSRFDDPTRNSAGEYMLLNPEGGAIAMYTTTRVVNASGNYELSEKLFRKNIFELSNRRPQRLGDIYTKAKNQTTDYINARKFSLLGDPALRITLPWDTIVTEEINGVPVDGGKTDTIRALQKITIKGYIKDREKGTIDEKFTGNLYPTVYDKPQSLTTLANDPGSSARKFSLQQNIVYRGKVTVKNGRFEFSFIAPKDISYTNQKGKISYYAENGTKDAAGEYENIVMSGGNITLTDSKPPVIKLYLNDTNFKDNGITNQNPLLLAHLSDDMGINTVGLGIGHEIIAKLDHENPLVLNEYYTNNRDDYKSGILKYPLTNLYEGLHKLTLRVWDVENNFSDAVLNFEVVNDKNLVIKRLYVYPNPASDRTTFSFEHNGQSNNLKANLNVYDVTGKLIRRFEQPISTGQGRNIDIVWNTDTDMGEKVPQGVYLYELILQNENGMISKSQNKLMLIRQ